MTYRSGLFGELRCSSEVRASGGSAVATFHVTMWSLRTKDEDERVSIPPIKRCIHSSPLHCSMKQLLEH